MSGKPGEDQIAADRKAANAFFARYDNPTSPQSQNVPRLVAYYAHDWKLLCCDMEARLWARRQPKNDRDHRAERAAAAQAERAAEEAARPAPLTRDDTHLRDYVAPGTRTLMPPLAITRPAGIQEGTRRGASTF